MIKKIFVFCVAIFTCVNVEAAMYNVGDVVTMSKKSATNTILSTYFNVVDRDGNIAPTTHAHKLNEFGWNKGTLSYWATTADGIKYLAFCQDPNLNSVSGTTYKIDSVFGEDVDDKETGMYDAAMLAIFRYFGDSSVNDDAKYAAEILALRATVATFGKGASASAISEYINTAVIWNSENSELANKVISKGVRLHGAISSERVAPNANGNGVYEEAKAAYYAGLEAAANYTDGDGRAKLETNKKTLITGTNVATTVTLEAFNFIGNENSKLKSLEIIVENPSVTYTCALDGSATSCEVGEGVQLKNGSKFEIIFKAVAQESEHCDSAKFTINYGITDDTLNGDSAYSLYKSGEDETHQSLQRFSFYVMPGDENILEDTVNGGIPVCGGNCEPEYYVPTDCIEAGDPETEVNSWYNSIDYDKDADPIQCVVNKTDSAGNSYTAKTCVYGETANDSARGQENGMKYVNDNKYCTVSCSEDYKFSYSGIQDTDSGRYFRVSAKISGVKTCYTSPIDYEQFARDIKAAQEEILKYFNEYYEYEKAVGTGLTHTEGCVAGCDGGTYESYYIGYDGYGGNPVTYTDKKSFAASYNEDTGEVSSLNETTGEAKVLKSEGDKGETELNDEDETVCKTHCKSGDKKLADLKSEIEAGMKNADEKLKTAQQKYYETIQAIIACAGDNTNVDTNFSFSTLNFSDIKNWGWKMLFPYDPTIQYSYDEKYDSSISAKDKLMIATPEYAGPEHTYYACSSGNCETLKTMDSNSTSYDSGNTVKFLYCELEKGCEKVEFYNFPVKELSVVSQKSTKNIEYKTPDIFYAAFPTTNIVYSPDGAVLEDEGKDGYKY